MTENEDVLDILKALVEKIQRLERTVYNQDNLLMKSGFVVVDSPSPTVSNNSDIPDSDTIAKMDWDDINKLVKQMGGQ